MKKHVVIGSRGSDLALWQANFVKSELEAINCSVEIKIIKTQGDKIQHLSFDKLEGKGFFTKEIEEVLLSGEVDLAVHSHKDLETTPPAGLKIACVSARANPADLLLIRKERADSTKKWSLKEGAIIGTSSARRKSLLKHHRNDLIINDLRGNVPTRIGKLREGTYDAIVIAKAGIDRLELDVSEFTAVVLDPTEFVPAPAQGVLGLQIRNDDASLADVLSRMNHPEVAKAIELERKILNLLEGGCQLPLGAHCTPSNELYVSFAPHVDAPCTFLHYQVSSFDSMAEKVISDLKKIAVV